MNTDEAAAAQERESNLQQRWRTVEEARDARRPDFIHPVAQQGTPDYLAPGLQGSMQLRDYQLQGAPLTLGVFPVQQHVPSRTTRVHGAQPAGQHAYARLPAPGRAPGLRHLTPPDASADAVRSTLLQQLTGAPLDSDTGLVSGM